MRKGKEKSLNKITNYFKFEVIKTDVDKLYKEYELRKWSRLIMHKNSNDQNAKDSDFFLVI